TLLLRLLLIRKWNVSPRLVLSEREFYPDELAESEGILIRKSKQQDFYSEFAYAEDLVLHWSDLTGHPFVFLVWATRPGTMSMHEYRRFNEAFHRSIRAYEVGLAEGRIADTFSRYNFFFYLDARSRASLDFCFNEALACNVLPESSYRSATYTLLDQKPI